MELTMLSQLKVGQRAVVQEVKDFGDISYRLQEMGILKGTLIEVVRFAPMGDPIDIKLRGYHLSLRREEAEKIFVSLPKDT